jgi:hypothetical protein
MAKPEELGPRNHGKIESGSTCGTTHGYVDERLPFPRGEGREVIGERLRDKTVSWQVQRRLMQAVTNSFGVVPV